MPKLRQRAERDGGRKYKALTHTIPQEKSLCPSPPFKYSAFPFSACPLE